MGSCNGRSDTIEDSEDARKAALEAALKSAEVAKNQQADLLQKFLEVYPHFEPESLESQDNPFLEVPEEVSELRLLVDHLKRFFVTLDQMLREESPGVEYKESCAGAKNQISQLIEYLTMLIILEEGEEAVDSVLPSLPKDLNTENSPSARQTRDYFTIRDYGRLIHLIQQKLNDFA